MESLNRLLKIAQQNVDVKRLVLAQLQAQQQEAQNQIEQLTVQTLLEKQKAPESECGGLTIEAYLQATKEKINSYTQIVSELEPQIDEAQVELQDAFKEMKILEITQAKKIKEIKEIQKRKEQKILDEIAQNMNISQRWE